MYAPGPATEVALVGSTRHLSLLVDSEATLRKEYLSTPRRAHQQERDASGPASRPARTSAAIVLDSTKFLELLVVLGAWTEAAVELHLETLRAVVANADRHMALVASICRYDPWQVVQENMDRFPGGIAAADVDMDAPRIDIEPILQFCLGSVATCPIKDLERRAAELASPELGHRCRRAYDSLVAFTQRNRLDQGDVGRAVGRAYAEGRLAVEEVASVLRVSVSDALVFLDQHGYARTLQRIELDEAERDAAYARIRCDRLERRGAAPVGARELAAETVIASQRIEDVDARRWLPNARRS